MANRFFSPNQQYISNEGVPLAGGWLYFYVTGSSTPQDTYNDAALTIANTNPIELDSDGYAGSVFLQDLPYKVVLEDADHNPIWTMDPVYSSDYSTLARFKPWAGNPNGQVAGFAGTQGALPGSDAIWDYVNNILYVATFTGNAATTVWTAVNSNSAAAITPAPQGYLTLNPDATNPIITGDTTATTIYYSPYMGNLVPVYNGSSFVSNTFTQLTLSLVSAHAASTLYDVFVFNNSGVLTLVTGPAWATSTAGSGNRGSGGSTTQLQRLSGIYVNAVQISGRNGSTLYTIAANTATYLGTIFIDTTPGQVTCHRSWGQNRKWGVWNAYNRLNIYLKCGDGTASWLVPSLGGTWRQCNAAAGNNLTVMSGLQEEPFDVRFSLRAQLLANQTTGVGIGLNSTTSTTGQISLVVGSNTTNLNITYQMTAAYSGPPILGINVYNALEYNQFGTQTNTGTESSMVLSAFWRG